MESDLGSSDLDVMDYDQRRPKKRITKKKKSEEEMSVDEPYSGREEDIEDFIVPHERPKHPRAQKVPKKTRVHDIFNTALIDKEPEISKEHKINKIYTKEEIEDQYATERDLKIKLSDVPERTLRNFTEE
jgi:hypothetical protein